MRRIIVLLAAMAATVVVCAGAALATPVDEVEPNDWIFQAQNIDRYFSLDSDPNITDSTTVPHATVNATGDFTYDYYSFTVPRAGVSTIGILDIDGAYPSFDSYLRLYDSRGIFLEQSDDSAPTDAGSTDGCSDCSGTYDSYLAYNFPRAGTYYIKVSQFVDDLVPPETSYKLNVSVPNHPTRNGKLPTGNENPAGAVSEQFQAPFTIDATSCTGEWIQVGGTFHIVRHFVGDRDPETGNLVGKYHVNSHFNFANMKGVVLDPGTFEPTDTEYVIPAAGTSVENSIPSSGTVNTGYVDINLAIQQGRTPKDTTITDPSNQLAFARIHYIVTDDGTVKVENMQLHFECH